MIDPLGALCRLLCVYRESQRTNLHGAFPRLLVAGGAASPCAAGAHQRGCCQGMFLVPSIPSAHQVREAQSRAPRHHMSWAASDPRVQAKAVAEEQVDAVLSEARMTAALKSLPADGSKEERDQVHPFSLPFSPLLSPLLSPLSFLLSPLSPLARSAHSCVASSFSPQQHG